MKFIKSLVMLSTLLSFAVAGTFVDDSEIGLRKISVKDENSVTLRDINYSAQPAGLSTRFDRAFENAPPMIPHDLDGLLPITTELNMCTTCHLPEFANDVGSTPVPKSHLVDLRSGEDNEGVLDGSRYNCVQCHTPQAKVNIAIQNNFKPEFFYKDGNSSSNLMDILNEGVK